MPRRTSKYGAKPTIVDNIRFASKSEAKRYSELKLELLAGEISGLVLQPRYPLKVNDKLICTYVADFEYTTRYGELVIEDVKGFETPVFKLKKKLFEALTGRQLVVSGNLRSKLRR